MKMLPKLSGFFSTMVRGTKSIGLPDRDLEYRSVILNESHLISRFRVHMPFKISMDNFDVQLPLKFTTLS